MELDAIAVFVKVVEAGSFSEAARLLKMPKTTVSARVAALEKRLGVTLIQRTTRKLSITEPGREYYRHCSLAMREIEDGELQLRSAQASPSGTLKITAPADFGHTILPKIVRKYLATYPEVSVQLILTNRLVDLVSEGIDLAIRASELKDSTLIAKKFFAIEAGFWATPSYLAKHGTPENPKDLARQQLIIRSDSATETLKLTDGKNTQSISVTGRIRVDDFEAVKAHVLLDQGIGWMPDFLSTEEAKEKRLVPVLSKWKLKFAFPMSFVYPGQKYSSPKVRAFMELAFRFIENQKPL